MPSWWTNDAGIEHAPSSVPLPDRCEIAIVGAGVVGLTAAYELLKTGARVHLIDAASSVGFGVSGQSSAKVTTGTGLRLDDSHASSGLDAAREYADAARCGLGVARELVSRAPWIRAMSVPHLLYATTPSGVEHLEDHVVLARECGLTARRTESLPFSWALASVSYDDQLLVVQPVDVLQALAGDVVALGGRFTFSTAVSGVRPDDNGVEVVTSGGAVRADRVIVATHVPLTGTTFLHWREQRHRVLVGRVSGPVPASYDVESGWSTRPVDDPDGSLALVTGTAHDVGAGEDQQAEVELRRWATEQLGVTVLQEWATQDATSFDALPLVGELNGSRVLTATGFGGWGWAHGFAAGHELARLVQGHEARWPSFAISSRRFGHGIANRASNLGQVAEDAVSDHVRLLGHLGSDPGAELERGDGVVRLSAGRTAAISVDSDGVRRTVSARCTHLGCLVRWNGSDSSWDCPCHGSRFSLDGAVLHGPATRPLEQLDD
jgi:glycine/D-amino acid oxidase-like deaminating enzyme/nitrite reductase/ring-hydroxylating ferredoxin subunit